MNTYQALTKTNHSDIQDSLKMTTLLMRHRVDNQLIYTLSTKRSNIIKINIYVNGFGPLGNDSILKRTVEHNQSRILLGLANDATIGT